MADPKRTIAKSCKSGQRLGRSTARGAACIGGGTGGFLYGFVKGAIDTVRELLPEGEPEEDEGGLTCSKCGDVWSEGTKFCPNDGTNLHVAANGRVISPDQMAARS